MGMNIRKADEFFRGWFLGNFEPTMAPFTEFEAAVKFYEKGDHEGKHLHKVSTEYTIIGAGKFRMGEKILEKGDIVQLEPNTACDFECLESGVTFVIKTPCAPADKYPVEDES